MAAVLAGTIGLVPSSGGTAEAQGEPNPALTRLQREYQDELQVNRLDARSDPVLAAIPVHWPRSRINGPVAYRLSVVDSSTTLRGAQVRSRVIGVGEIGPGGESLEIRLLPAAVRSMSDLATNTGSVVFEITVVDARVRGSFQFERWHPGSRSARESVAGGSERTSARSAGAALNSIEQASDRWAVASPANLRSVAAAAASGNSSRLQRELAAVEREAEEFLATEEARNSESGAAQGLVLSSIETVVTNAPSARQQFPPWFACGSLPYLQAMWFFVHDDGKRWHKVASVGTGHHTRTTTLMVNSSRSSSQGVVAWAGGPANAALTGFRSFNTAGSQEWNRPLRNRFVEFQKDVRYNSYVMRCPDMHRPGVWHDLPDRMMLPSHWTGGVRNVVRSSLGWTPNEKWCVRFGRNMTIGQGETRTFDRGLNFGLFGINVGVRQKTEADERWSVTYNRVRRGQAHICGRFDDPVRSVETQQLERS